MEKSELRAVIKHMYSKGLTPKEIKAELDEVHGTSAPVFGNVCNWVNEFKRGHTFTKDEHRSGRPLEVDDFARKIGCEKNLGKTGAAFTLRGE